MLPLWSMEPLACEVPDLWSPLPLGPSYVEPQYVEALVCGSHMATASFEEVTVLLQRSWVSQSLLWGSGWPLRMTISKRCLDGPEFVGYCQKRKGGCCGILV